MTEWRTIPSAPDYEASDDGNVRRRCAQWYPWKPGKILARSMNWQGRYAVRLFIDGKSRTRMLARLICEAFHGPPPSAEHQAAHRDGSKTNDTPDNLAWLTRRENYQDQIRHGTSKRGEGHHIAKLTDDAVRDIRQRAGTVMQKDLAAEYDVSASTICMVISRQIWPHVQDEVNDG